MFNEREIKEFEWYLRDHLFRQAGQGRQKFQKAGLPEEMMNLYLRYRNSNSEKLNALTAIAIEKLLSVRVIERTMTGDELLELTTKLSRLQCANCFYISYLSSNEARKCLRCPSVELHDFPSSEKLPTT